MFTKLVFKDGIGELIKANSALDSDLLSLSVLLLSAKFPHRLLTAYNKIQIATIVALIEAASEEIGTKFVFFRLFLSFY